MFCWKTKEKECTECFVGNKRKGLYRMFCVKQNIRNVQNVLLETKDKECTECFVGKQKIRNVQKVLLETKFKECT